MPLALYGHRVAVMLPNVIIECRKCATPRLRFTDTGKKNKCKPCRAASMKRWSDTHREEKRAKDRAWRKANPEKVQAYWNAWEAANAERYAAKRAAWIAAHPDRGKYDPSYYRATKDLWLHRQAARRARKRQAEGSHTLAEWKEVQGRQRGRCFDCGREAKLTRGHLVPLIRGGSDYIANIVAQCRPCNARQGTKIHPSVNAMATAC